MNNLQGPAFPISEVEYNRYTGCTGPWTGFTKLEKGALMIAAGMMGGAWSDQITDKQLEYIKETATMVAKAVIEECNK